MNCLILFLGEIKKGNGALMVHAKQYKISKVRKAKLFALFAITLRSLRETPTGYKPQ
jgi:hypothetical protein